MAGALGRDLTRRACACAPHPRQRQQPRAAAAAAAARAPPFGRRAAAAAGRAAAAAAVSARAPPDGRRAAAAAGRAAAATAVPRASADAAPCSTSGRERGEPSAATPPWLSRSELLLGEEAMRTLAATRVLLVGLGAHGCLGRRPVAPPLCPPTPTGRLTQCARPCLAPLQTHTNE